MVSQVCSFGEYTKVSFASNQWYVYKLLQGIVFFVDVGKYKNKVVPLKTEKVIERLAQSFIPQNLIML